MLRSENVRDYDVVEKTGDGLARVRIAFALAFARTSFHTEGRVESRRERCCVRVVRASLYVGAPEICVFFELRKGFLFTYPVFYSTFAAILPVKICTLGLVRLSGAHTRLFAPRMLGDPSP